MQDVVEYSYNKQPPGEAWAPLFWACIAVFNAYQTNTNACYLNEPPETCIQWEWFFAKYDGGLALFLAACLLTILRRFYFVRLTPEAVEIGRNGRFLSLPYKDITELRLMPLDDAAYYYVRYGNEWLKIYRDRLNDPADFGRIGTELERRAGRPVVPVPGKHFFRRRKEAPPVAYLIAFGVPSAIVAVIYLATSAVPWIILVLLTFFAVLCVSTIVRVVHKSAEMGDVKSPDAL